MEYSVNNLIILNMLHKCIHFTFFNNKELYKSSCIIINYVKKMMSYSEYIEKHSYYDKEIYIYLKCKTRVW